MGRLVQGYWDCKYCGTKGIRGDVHNCTSCGRARGDVKFYMKNIAEDAEIEADQRDEIEYAENNDINRNPDWYCSFCNSLNSDNAAFCSSCGATRQASESNYFEQLRKMKEKEAAESNAGSAVHEKKNDRKKPAFIFFVFILVIVAVFAFLNSNKTAEDLKVTGLSWERTIEIEREKEFSESNWTLPSGASQTGTRSEIHHYDQVLDHYEDVPVQRSRQVIDYYEKYYTYDDLGNGYFDEVEHERPVYRTEYYTEVQSQPVYISVPRYQTKYYYTIMRWVPERSVSSSGNDHEPYWPEFELGQSERESERKGFYFFSVTDPKGNVSRYRTEEENWEKLSMNDVIIITAKRNGSEIYITDKDGNRKAQIWKY